MHSCLHLSACYYHNVTTSQLRTRPPAGHGAVGGVQQGDCEEEAGAQRHGGALHGDGVGGGGAPVYLYSVSAVHSRCSPIVKPSHSTPRTACHAPQCREQIGKT